MLLTQYIRLDRVLKASKSLYFRNITTNYSTKITVLDYAIDS